MQANNFSAHIGLCNEFKQTDSLFKAVVKLRLFLIWVIPYLKVETGAYCWVIQKFSTYFSFLIRGSSLVSQPKLNVVNIFCIK